MHKRVNFEDSLFILMTRIRMIRDIITLDADTNLFLEKTLDDVFFVDRALATLLEHLESNRELIDRAQLLLDLSDLEWQFSQALYSLLTTDSNLSIREIPVFREKISACRDASTERQRAAERIGAGANEMSASPIVSSHEIAELLKAF
jgi:hypothetical protein